MDREALIREASEDHLRKEAGRRRFIYRDVEALIEHRFLTHWVDFGDTRVVFRSMLPSDYHWCKSASKTVLEYSCWALACSVWSIDGLEISAGQAEARRILYREWATKLSRVEIDSYEFVLIGLKNRVDRALNLTEAFCYEPYSRALWRLLGKPTLGRDENAVMRSWVAFNMAEDSNLQDSREWDRAAVIVGSMSNKAAKHVGQSLEKREQSEKSRRQRVVEDAVNWVIYGTEEREKFKIEYGGKTWEVPAIAAPTTLAELEDEMRKVMSGEHDYHDQMVENYHETIRQKVEERRAEARQKQEESRLRREQAELEGKPSLVGYTPEQLQALSPGVSRTKTTGTQADNSSTDRLYGRYVAPKIVPGVLTPDIKVVNAERETQNPEAPKKESLQEQVAKRTPTLR